MSRIATSRLIVSGTGRATLSVIVLNALLFQIAWIVNVLDLYMVAPVVTGAVVAVHLLAVRYFFGFSSAARECVWLAFVTAIGLLVEYMFCLFGILQHETEAIWGVPTWLLLLWLAFATTFRFSLAFLQKHLLMGFAFGAAAALSYWGGAALNPASRLGDSSWAALMWIALVWSLLLPSLARLHGRYVT